MAVAVKRNSPMNVVYIEVNSTNFQNVGCYSVKGTDSPLFDIGIIFAANIKFDVPTQTAWLYINENITKVLDEIDTCVRPLQAKGIKVLLSILGGGEGQGICNFPSEEKARDFAVILADVVKKYDLDGIDFDDEYAQYGDNNTPDPNAGSFIYLLKELRQLIPDKIISFYYYGPATSRLEYAGYVAGQFLDYSWNSIYGTYSVPNVPGLEKGQLGPAAIWVDSTNATTAANYAKRTVDEGYGIYLNYDLKNSNSEAYLNGIAEQLYGSGATLTEGCLRPWPTGHMQPIKHPEGSSRARPKE